MRTDRAERFSRENRKRFLQGSLLLLVLLWAYSGVVTQTLPIEGTILFGVVFIAFTMEPVSRDVLEVDESVAENEICAGWDTFEHRDTNRESPIRGGENPIVCVNDERNPAQHASVDDWFQTIYHDLWVTGRSPAQLLDGGDYPHRLPRWANRSEEKERWLEQVSSDTDIHRATLFQL